MNTESLKGVISQKVLNAVHNYQSAFSSATPFKHIVIDNFFEPNIINRMLQDFPLTPDMESLRNEFGGKSKKHSRTDVQKIGGVYNLIDKTIATEEFATFMSNVTGIEDLLYDPEYIGGGTHHNFEGQGMYPHVDFNYHPSTGFHRRLNAIVYLNTEWKSEWGGTLDLHKNAWDSADDEKISIVPGLGTCVIFETSEHSWHGFDKIRLPEGKKHLSRKSFAIYMYTQTRPVDQIYPKHATIYVQKGMEPHIQAGYTMSEDDIQGIKDNFHTRNLYLQSLYGRETKFINTISVLNRQLTVYQNNYRLLMFGYVQQIALDPVPYPDGWIRKSITLKLRALKSVNKIELQTRIPDENHYAQKIKLTVSGDEFEINQVSKVQTSGFKMSRIPKGGTFTITLTGNISESAKQFGLSEDKRALSFKIDSLTFN